MAVWQYQCVSCGGVHEVSVRPAGEAMLLRCVVTRQWNWHEPAAFLALAADTSTELASAPKAKATGRVRAAGRARRSSSGLRAAARTRARHASRAAGSRKRSARKVRAKARKR
jgi:hypothetical protein